MASVVDLCSFTSLGVIMANLAAVIPHPSRVFHRLTVRQSRATYGLSALLMLVMAGAGVVGNAAPALALEEIEVIYGEFESPPISLDELEEFARTGQASPDLQRLLVLLPIETSKARELLIQEIPVDLASLRQASNTFVGQFFWRLVSTTIITSEGSAETWILLRDAVLQTAARDRISLLEVLRNLNSTRVRIDSQRIVDLVAQLSSEDLQLLALIFLGQ